MIIFPFMPPFVHHIPSYHEYDEETREQNVEIQEDKNTVFIDPQGNIVESVSVKKHEN